VVRSRQVGLFGLREAGLAPVRSFPALWLQVLAAAGCRSQGPGLPALGLRVGRPRPGSGQRRPGLGVPAGWRLRSPEALGQRLAPARAAAAQRTRARVLVAVRCRLRFGRRSVCLRGAGCRDRLRNHLFWRASFLLRRGVGLRCVVRWSVWSLGFHCDYNQSGTPAYICRFRLYPS